MCTRETTLPRLPLPLRSLMSEDGRLGFSTAILDTYADTPESCPDIRTVAYPVFADQPWDDHQRLRIPRTYVAFVDVQTMCSFLLYPYALAHWLSKLDTPTGNDD